MEKLRHRLDTEGYPYQRPRLGKYGNAYNPVKYGKYREYISFLIKNLNLPKKDYILLKINFFYAYPASTPQKKRLNLRPCVKNYDLDNLVKAFMDALQDAGVIKDDRTICGINSMKLYTIEKKGWIEFEID